MPVIPAKGGGRESQSQASLGKSPRPYLENKLKAKELGVWPKW
jgi:hypothetical protein